MRDGDIEAVRRFNRFYTQRIGVLDEGLLASRFTLAQGRVLFELGIRDGATAGELGAVLGLDAGYLSRILQGFVDSRLVIRKQSPQDGRRVDLSLSAKGRKVFLGLDRRSRRQIGVMIAAVPAPERAALVRAMQTVEHALSPPEGRRRAAVAIRTHRPGDIGWAIERHGRLYTDEFGWNQEFEGLVATLFAKFATRHDPASEQFWVAEVGGERAGCVFLVRSDDDPRAAQLRCLLVEPWGRGLGIGRRLVDECIGFATSAGYARMVLWTNDVLSAARRIYQACGFSLVQESPHHSFGHDLVGQIWSRPL